MYRLQFSIFTTLILLLISNNSFSQFNYVQNWDLEIAKSDKSPSCTYQRCEVYNKYQKHEPWKIEQDIENWSNALHDPSCPQSCLFDIERCPTSDWIDKRTCNNGGFSLNTPSNRFFQCLIDVQGQNKYWYEGVNSILKEKLIPNKNYVLRVKLSKPVSDKKVTFSCYITKWQQHWNSNWSENNKLKIGTLEVGANSIDAWINEEIKFSIPSSIGDFGNVLTLVRDYNSGDESKSSIDRIELFEDGCDNQLLIENRVYDFPDEGKYEALKITSGFDANEPRVVNGIVTINSGTHLEYKAGEEINLLPGFESTAGSEFWAHIAPCGVPCDPPNLNLQNLISVCDGQCTFIGATTNNTNEYEWSAEPTSALEYLKYTNSGNPLFCPPATGSGTIKYTVRIKNSCGEIAYKTVFVRFQKTVNNFPSFTVVSTDMQQSKVRITLKVGDETDTISVFLLYCNTNVVKESFTYVAGKDFTGEDFEFNYENNCLNPCQCLKWKICTKNFCSTAEYCNTIPWTRSTNFKAVIPNVTFCDDDGYHFCFYTEGVTSATVSIFNRWGQHLDDNTGVAINERLLTGDCNTKCITINKQTYSGTYFSEIVFIDCAGVSHTIKTDLTFIPCNNLVFSNDTNISDVTTTEFYIKDENNVIIDSVYFTFSPNPVSELLTMSYHLPIAANVSIKVYSPQTGLTKEFLTNYSSLAGNFNYTIPVEDLPFGYNYLFLEVTQTNSITFSRKFMIIH